MGQIPPLSTSAMSGPVGKHARPPYSHLSFFRRARG